jgi:iron complex transport system substrate-binding protein
MTTRTASRIVERRGPSTRHRTKRRAIALLALGAVVATACGSDDDSAATATTAAPSSSSADTTTPTAARTTYPVTVDNCGATVTVDASPVHVLGDQEQDAVPLFELGAGDRVKAIFSHFGGELGFIEAFDPAIVSAIQALPDLDGDAGSAYPVFELVLQEKPDFIFQAYPESALGGDEKNRAALEASGIPVYTLTANCADDASFESHFTDLENLGLILDLQDEATALIAERRALLDELETTVADAERPNVFLLDSFAEGGVIYTNTGSFTRDTITIAGGTPVPEPGPDRYSASLEKVAAANVDVLLVTHYPESVGVGTDEERAQQWFEAFPNSPAAKDQRWAAVPYPGGPNAIVIAQTFAQAIHPDLFPS